MPVVAHRGLPPKYGSSYLEPAALRHVVFVDRVGTGRRKALDLRPVAPFETISPAADDDQPATTSAVSAEGESFAQWLFAKAGLDARCYGSQTLGRRMNSCLRVLRATSFAHARRIIEHQPSLTAPAMSALVIGVTQFFRDTGVFETLRQEVLPRMASARPGLRIWSAGCSEGAELYSVQMLLAELGLLQRCELLGSDCRSDAVAKARSGCYEPSALRGVDERMLEQYFRRELSGSWRVVENLRSGAQWRTADVLCQVEPGPWDIILCRNMAMYLRPEAAVRLWRSIEAALRPGGVLVLGKAERPLGAAGMVNVAPCIYRRNWG